MKPTNSLAKYLRVAQEVASEIGDESQDVPWAFLRGRIPIADRAETIGRARLRVALDLAGIRATEDIRTLRQYARGTGPLDQAFRLRRAFLGRVFGPSEGIEAETLHALARVTGSASRAVDDLVDALARVGFPRFGHIVHKWGRERVILPDGELDLRLERQPVSIELAKHRVIRRHAGPLADPVLLRHFPQFARYTSPAQRDAVRALLDPKGPPNVLVRLPTGAGKSLLYLLPCAEWRASNEPSTTIVVSPIIALQNDQVQKIERQYATAGLEARQVNSTVPRDERTKTYRLLRAGKLDLLFLSPERVAEPLFREILAIASKHIRMLVIDEAHMVDEWGQDFRPDFFRLGRERERLLERVPNLRTLFLSATMTSESEATLAHVFRLPVAPVTFTDPTLRTEVSIRVVRSPNDETKGVALHALLENAPLPCIIYCSKVDHVRELKKGLKSSGIRRVMDYMGPTAADQRETRLRWFHDGDVDFVLATSAFGLGVDKADVRTIVHYDVPHSLDGYYQAIGRAARDGETGHAFMLYSSASMAVATRENRAILSAEIAVERAQLMLEGRQELRWDGKGACLLPLHAVPSRLDGDSEMNRKWNFAVLNILEQVGGMRVDGVVHRCVTVRRGSNGLGLAKEEATWLRASLKRTGDSALDLFKISRRERLPLATISQALARLVLDRSIELVDESDHEKDEQWVLVHRQGDITWSRKHTLLIERHREARLERANREIEQLRRFLRSTACRFHPIAAVYDFAVPARCGHCDVCDPALKL